MHRCAVWFTVKCAQDAFDQQPFVDLLEAEGLSPQLQARMGLSVPCVLRDLQHL